MVGGSGPAYLCLLDGFAHLIYFLHDAPDLLLTRLVCQTQQLISQPKAALSARYVKVEESRGLFERFDARVLLLIEEAPDATDYSIYETVQLHVQICCSPQFLVLGEALAEMYSYIFDAVPGEVVLPEELRMLGCPDS
jgi:hypothetical protein